MYKTFVFTDEPVILLVYDIIMYACCRKSFMLLKIDFVVKCRNLTKLTFTKNATAYETYTKHDAF